jgi:hypothetical protein
MKDPQFQGFSAAMFRFFRDLHANNKKDWFDVHRREYQTDVLETITAFASELGQWVRLLNPEFETEPRVGRTISRIVNDTRVRKDRPPYRPSISVSYRLRGNKRRDGALLYAGITSSGVSVGFNPGRHHTSRTGPIQQGITRNARAFQRYLTERRIPDRYWELTGKAPEQVKKWPLPRTANRWIDLEGFTVGEHFEASDPLLTKRSFLDRAQAIVLDLYPLWLLSTSQNLKQDLELYSENATALARSLTSSRRSPDVRRERASGKRQSPVRSIRQPR